MTDQDPCGPVPALTDPALIDPALTDPALLRVRASADLTGAVATLPLTEHAGVYQQVHGALQDALTEIDGG